MLVLGIDTSTTQPSIALLKPSIGVLAAKSLPRDKRPGEVLLHAVEHLLKEQKAEKRELSLVAVGLGPGLFSSLRVGLAAAQGICAGLGIHAIGVPSMYGIAVEEEHSKKCSEVVILLDAGREACFLSAVSDPPPHEEASGSHHPHMQKYSIEELFQFLDTRDKPTYVACSPALFHQERLSALRNHPSLVLSTQASVPRADKIAAHGYRMFRERGPMAPSSLQPMYGSKAPF